MIINCAELFAGAGLLGGGFQKKGFNTVFAAELDSRAVSSYNKNLDPVAEIWDVREVKKNVSYDVLLAGPPCQGFSTLGKRDPKDIRNQLSLSVFDWAKEHQPKVVVIENVPQFLSSSFWRRLVDNFSSEGYEYVSWVLNSNDYGVAQNRSRSFTIFSRIGLPAKPKPTSGPKTVKEALAGLPEDVDENNLHTSPAPTEIGLARMKVIPPKGDKRDVIKNAPELCPPSWLKMGNQAVDVWGRMDWDKPANTIRCSFIYASKGRYIHPIKNRVISLREGARLQGIPDSWQFDGDRTSIARQIGNGVPVPLAMAVADSIKALFD